MPLQKALSSVRTQSLRPRTGFHTASRPPPAIPQMNVELLAQHTALLLVTVCEAHPQRT